MRRPKGGGGGGGKWHDLHTYIVHKQRQARVTRCTTAPVPFVHAVYSEHTKREAGVEENVCSCGYTCIHMQHVCVCVCVVSLFNYSHNIHDMNGKVNTQPCSVSAICCTCMLTFCYTHMHAHTHMHTHLGYPHPDPVPSQHLQQHHSVWR